MWAAIILTIWGMSIPGSTLASKLFRKQKQTGVDGVLTFVVAVFPVVNTVWTLTVMLWSIVEGV
jgi:hypothetical protein